MQKVAVGAAAGAIAGKILGKSTKATVIGGAAGAAAGAAVAAGTANYQGCINEGSRITISLTAPLSMTTSYSPGTRYSNLKVPFAPVTTVRPAGRFAPEAFTTAPDTGCPSRSNTVPERVPVSAAHASEGTAMTRATNKVRLNPFHRAICGWNGS